MQVGTGLIHSFWNVAAWSGMRRLGTFLQRAYPSAYADTAFFKKDMDGAIVALTIDDGLARNPDCSMVGEVRDLLKAYNAHATFCVCTDYTTRSDALLLLEDNGNEFGNHLQEDRSGYYFRLSKDAFRQALREANQFLKEECEVVCPKWFRAPQGVMTTSMSEVVREEGMTHVLGDCYCDDWAFAEDGDTRRVAPLMLKQVQSGSIAIFHMPERGFREASFEALKKFLEGVNERGMRCVSLTEMMEMGEATDA
jgi:peptidoglycan/xylan/chitin deacetylase (PgdA/CDA1 family)